MDGESEPVPAPRTDQHLGSCSECQVWQERAVAVAQLGLALSQVFGVGATADHANKTQCP